MSQAAEVLDLLRSRGDRGITAVEALELVGSFRLAARIADLRRAGYAISSTPVETPTGKRIARYVLVHPMIQETLHL